MYVDTHRFRLSTLLPDTYRLLAICAFEQESCVCQLLDVWSLHEFDAVGTQVWSQVVVLIGLCGKLFMVA